MSDPELFENESDQSSQRIKFDYLKTNCFRTVYANGAIGGVTPQGNLHFAFWSQRNPIPRQVVYEMLPNGQVGKEVDRVCRDAVIREVEIGVILDPESARSFADLIYQQLELLEAAKTSQNSIIE